VVLVSGLVQTWFSYHEHEAALVRTQREQSCRGSYTDRPIRCRDRAQIAAVLTGHGLTGSQAPGQLYDDYLRLIRQVPAITAISYLDAAGVERRAAPGRDVVDNHTSRADDPALRLARSGRAYFGPVYFREQTEPYMVVAVAETGRNGGVSVAEVNLKLIWDVVTRIRIGDAGYAYVVDAHGLLVAHPDISLVLQRTDLSGRPQVQDALANAEPTTAQPLAATIGPNLHGRQVLSTHATVDPPGWAVLAEQPLEEVFAPLYAALGRTALLLVIALGFGARQRPACSRMAAPILALRDGAARLEAGALDQRIRVDSGDELEVLADEFNRVAERLRESYAGLEQKVEARTAELAAAMRELEDKSGQLEIASRHKSAFLANMSHELRTPLNAILGYTELTRTASTARCRSAREVLVRVDRNGRHLLRLINDVLDLSKIEAGPTGPPVSDYSLRDLV
jgi:HAMP domain-containing protein